MAKLKTYSVASDITKGKLIEGKLHAEILASGHVAGFVGVSRSEDSFEILGDSLANEAALDALVLAHDTLPEYKQEKMDAIDARTAELISQGFPFNGQTFSLSVPAQLNWTSLYTKKASITFPINISTKDGGEYSIADSAEIDSFTDTALGFGKAHYDSGRALRLQVLAATDEAGVDAVVDSR